jgi:hypothetical protein
VIYNIGGSECYINSGVFKQVGYFVYQWIMEGEGDPCSSIYSGVHGLCRASVGEFSTSVVNDL